MSIAGYDNSITIGEMFAYLDDLHSKNGRMNMFAAEGPLANQFYLLRSESREVLSAWMRTYDPEATPEDRASEALEMSEAPK